MDGTFRLSISNFDRRPGLIVPKKAYILSVEGNDAEVAYFKGIATYRSELGIDPLIDICVLRHRDTKSAPKWVKELMEEYFHLRGRSIYECIRFIDQGLLDGITEDELDKWEQEDASLPEDRREFIDKKTKTWDLDLAYLSYLKNNAHDGDVFCIVIDRDCQSNSEEAIDDCIAWGNRANRFCCITNPCFEFWLLLHVCNVKGDNDIDLKAVLRNEKVSTSHSYVSKKLSERTKQNKTVREFHDRYLPYVDEAINRVRNDFATDLSELKNNIGSNIVELIDMMRRDKLVQHNLSEGVDK